VEIKLHRNSLIERLQGTSAYERSIEIMVENALNNGFVIDIRISVKS
jgi:hypothetical protein